MRHLLGVARAVTLHRRLADAIGCAPGWPRPRCTYQTELGTFTLPRPWILARGRRDAAPQWAEFDRARAKAAHERRLCQVCGDSLQQIIVLGLVQCSDDETSGPGCHPRCAALMAQHCPHFARATRSPAATVAFRYEGEGCGYELPVGYDPELPFATVNPVLIDPDAEPMTRDDLRVLAAHDPLGLGQLSPHRPRSSRRRLRTATRHAPPPSPPYSFGGSTMASPSNDTAAPARTDAALAHLLDTARTEARDAASALLRAAQLEQAAQPHATCCIPWGVLRFVARTVSDPSDIPTPDACMVDQIDADTSASPTVVPLACATRAGEEVERAIDALAKAAAALEEAARSGSVPQTRVHMLWFFARALDAQFGRPDTFGARAWHARQSIARMVSRDQESEER